MIPGNNFNLNVPTSLLMIQLLLLSEFSGKLFFLYFRIPCDEISSTVEIRLYLGEHGIMFLVFLLPLENLMY